MAKTVVFDRFNAIIFPDACAGCSTPGPHSHMWITTGRGAGKSVAGKLGLKAGHAVTGTLGMLLGGPIGGGLFAAGFDALTRRDTVTAVRVPVCESCLNALSSAEKKQLDDVFKKAPGDFFVSSVKNRILSCKVKGNTVQLTLQNDSIATALIALNGDGVTTKELEGGFRQYLPPKTDAAADGQTSGNTVVNDEVPVDYLEIMKGAV